MYVVEDFVHRFNRYSLTYVALTGESYVDGAHKTQRMMAANPSLEKVVAGHGTIHTFISSAFMSVLLYPMLAIATPAAAPVALAASMVVQCSAASAVYEGFPATVLLCAHEGRNALPANAPRHVADDHDAAARLTAYATTLPKHKAE